MIRILLYLVISSFVFSGSLFAQSDANVNMRIVQIPISWTDTTRTDQLSISIHSNCGLDTILLSRTLKGGTQTIYSIPLQSGNLFTSFKGAFTFNNNDSLFAYSKQESHLQFSKYRVPIYRYPSIEHAVPVPMRIIRTDGQVNLLPTNHFWKTDTIYFEFVLRLPDSLTTDQYMYQLIIQSSLADTVVNMYKRLQNSGFLTITGQIPGSKFESGRYNIQVNIFRNNFNITSSASLPFYVLLSKTDSVGSAGKLASSNPSSLVFSSYSDNELDLLFDQAKYIALPEELTLYSRLTSLSQKQTFMETFWSNRSQDPNNNLISYSEKISHVNRVYRGGGKEGYLTDRGKVYLKYGPCDDVFISTSEVNVKPYEVWYYPELKGQSSVYFYFVDLSGYGNYQLVHSTARDEVYNLQYLLRLGIDPTSYREQ